MSLITNSDNFSQLNDSEGTQDNIPPLPDARDPVVGAPADTGPILPVPKGIRPTLAKYRYRMKELFLEGFFLDIQSLRTIGDLQREAQASTLLTLYVDL